ncbi:synapse differentiation-inducing gene protein 1-like [Esox lucius]|uniref:synapse differentiation-inducing gene protein 1-like n=1 Tax=Esox lucius TaxID=8010 RepID=UPI001477644B|nr:synapse differentiation-inducing gene protein 1-like [Esox lucius]XP_012991000.2 synapse differentiation-inducing gene protein 1-like [Esox lucius]XP_019898519.2 synapse differentiation-inducing gene protein 1-like [Esox lucius]
MPMESLDELQHPLLGGESPETDPRSPVTTCTPNGLFKGVLMRSEGDKTLPPLDRRGYCGGPGGRAGPQHPQTQPQLLHPSSLPSAPYPNAPFWGHPDALCLANKDYLETTFVDFHPGSSLERKLLAEAQQEVNSVSYSLEDDEDDLLPDYEDSSSDDFSDTESDGNFPLVIPQDYLGLAFFSMLCCFWPLGIAAFYLSQKTNKASAQGDFQGASAASRHALWLSVLSILFGIITYICAIAALISYLSGKPT